MKGSFKRAAGVVCAVVAAVSAAPDSVACSSGPAQVILETGLVHYTSMGIGQISGTGAELDGMPVTVRFDDGFEESVIWREGDIFDKGCAQSATVNDGEPIWRIELEGNSFEWYWTVWHSRRASLVGITMDGAPANAVFDEGDYEGTTGSGLGRSFVLISEQEICEVRAIFRDAVALVDRDPVGDLYRRMEIDLGTGLGGNSVMRMAIDTDELAMAGDLLPSCCPGDFDCDGTRDINDIVGFFTAFSLMDQSADHNGDGVLNLFDLLLFVEDFGSAC